MVEDDWFVGVGDAPQDGSWRTWSEDEFWLVLWLVETTASATCIIPPDADSELWCKAQSLLETIHAHQALRDTRRRQGRTLATDAALIVSREHVAARLEAMRADGLLIGFRPSGERSGIALSVRPAAG